MMLRSFRRANQQVVLPKLRHRVIGAWVGGPVISYFLALTTSGLRSGLPRRTL